METFDTPTLTAMLVENLKADALLVDYYDRKTVIDMKAMLKQLEVFQQKLKAVGKYWEKPS